MLKIFSYLGNEWQFTAELQPVITTNWSSQTNLPANSQGLVLAYNQEFVTANWQHKMQCALSQNMPLQLMEVFAHEQTSSWLEQYEPLRPQQINPQYTFGNIIISASDADDLNTVAVDTMTPLELSTIASDEFYVSAKRLLGWYSGNQYLFAKLANKNLYPVDFVAQKSNSSWIFIPFYSLLELQNSTVNKQDLDACLNAQTLFFATLNRCAGEFDKKGTKQLMSQSNFLSRFDVKENALCKVNTLPQVLGFQWSECSDFLEFIKKCVSANKQWHVLDLAPDKLILLLLFRDLICRTFTYVSHRSCFNLVYHPDETLFAPVIWDRNPTSEDRPGLEWPAEYMHLNRPDYPAICAALSAYAEPHELLFNLTESAENLCKINSVLLADNPDAGRKVSHMYGLSSVAQKLHQMELIL